MLHLNSIQDLAKMILNALGFEQPAFSIQVAPEFQIRKSPSIKTPESSNIRKVRREQDTMQSPGPSL